MREFDIKVSKQRGINFDVIARTKKIAQHPGAFLAKEEQNQRPREQRQQLRPGNKVDKRVEFDLSTSCFRSVFSQGCIKLLN